MFPSSTTPFEQSRSSLFGGTSTGCFGQAPGATLAAPPTPFAGSSFGHKPSFGGFGSTFQQDGSNPFGSTSSFSTANQPTFGAPSQPVFSGVTTPAFGVGSNSAFGATSSPSFRSATTSFSGSTVTGFGVSSYPTFGASAIPAFGYGSTPTFGVAPFGQTTSTSGSTLFGTSSTSFGSQGSPLGFGHHGSRLTAFVRTPETDSAGTISKGKNGEALRLESISAMPRYQGKSHEELRLEDYLCCDKGGVNPSGHQANPLFPSSTPNPFSFKPQTRASSGFSSSSTSIAQSPSNSTSTNLFTYTPSTPLPFGNTSSTTLPFGNTPPAISPFRNTPTTLPFSTPAISPFGNTPTTLPFSTPTNLPFSNTSSTILPLGNTSSPMLPFGKTHSSTPPFFNFQSTSLPFGNNTQSTNLPLGNTKSTGLPFCNTPSTSLPFCNTPTTSLPFVYNPSTSLPLVYNPSTSLPLVYNPSTSLPFGTPTGRLPFGNTPSTGLPFGNTPSNNLPVGNIPLTSQPFANTPTTNVPFGITHSTNLPFSSSSAISNAFQTSSTPQTSSLTNIGQTQTGTLGGLGNFINQGTYVQSSVTSQLSMVGQPAPITNPFGTPTAVPQTRVGSLPLIQFGISSMPVAETLSPVRISSLSTPRHLSQRKIKLPARHYHPKKDGQRVPFFVDDGSTRTKPMSDAYFVPRENPRSLIICPIESWPPRTMGETQSILKDSHPDKENGRPDEDSHNTGTNNSPMSSSEPSQKTNGVHVDHAEQEKDTLSIQASGRSNVDAAIMLEHGADSTTLMPKLGHTDYYTEPRIQELAAKEQVEPGSCRHVKDFTVGRHGYGSIKFYGETDVSRLDLESIVQFNNREVIVYIDESKKPPVGEGLNKPAEITLLNVKCMNNKTGQQFTEGPEVDKYKEMLMKKSEEQGAEFISYDPIQEEWKFKVTHFSRYGCI